MKNLQKGFSLIELLVVVAIIGILAAIGSVGYSRYIANAQSTETLANLAQVASLIAAEDTQVSTCTGLSASSCANKVVSGATYVSTIPTCAGNTTADTYYTLAVSGTVTIIGCPKGSVSGSTPTTKIVTVNSVWGN
jgi:type IV pilus assembly protein PilA